LQVIIFMRDITSFIPFLSILLTLIGGGLGYLLKHIIEKKKELSSEVSKVRREVYQQFVDLIIDILGDVKKNEKIEDIGSKQISKLYDFYKKYVIYASPGVINAFSNYFQYLYSIVNNVQKQDDIRLFRLLTRVMVEMRKDLGLNNRKLGKDGVYLMRALISDFDEKVKK